MVAVTDAPRPGDPIRQAAMRVFIGCDAADVQADDPLGPLKTALPPFGNAVADAADRMEATAGRLEAALRELKDAVAKLGQPAPDTGEILDQIARGSTAIVHRLGPDIERRTSSMVAGLMFAAWLVGMVMGGGFVWWVR
jgi:hypothetical protein